MAVLDLGYFINRMGKESNNPNFGAMVRQRRRTEWQMREVVITYDEGWREIFREVGNDLKMPREDVERINTAWWKYVTEMMCNPILPTIRMVYLGTIQPSVKLLYRYCDHMNRLIEKIYRGEYGANGKRVGDVRKMQDHLTSLQDTYLRLSDEAGKRKKVITEMKSRTVVEGEDERRDEYIRGRKKTRLTEVTMREIRKMDK